MKDAQLKTLLHAARAHYRRAGRSQLPWRTTHNPYRILVSEIMLQQTQAERVVPFYRAFLRAFPTAHALGRAPLSTVLRKWQGLGYNRRAKFLHDMARTTAGRLPKTARELAALPGVGPYTAGAVMAFAHNAPEVFIETNIRTVFIHHCFPRVRRVSDERILPLVGEALRRSGMEPREYYAMLMDYGTLLKKSGVKLNGKSTHYVKQKKFAGSTRQLRGLIMRALLVAPSTSAQLAKKISRKSGETTRTLARLAQEGMVKRTGRSYRIYS